MCDLSKLTIHKEALFNILLCHACVCVCVRICIHIHTYMHTITINEKETMNLTDSKKGLEGKRNIAIILKSQKYIKIHAGNIEDIRELLQKFGKHYPKTMSTDKVK